jgi:hypothetical protein
VRDANGQALAYLYSRESEGEARQAKVLTLDEARRIAVNIARLPELLGKADRELERNTLPLLSFCNRRRDLSLDRTAGARPRPVGTTTPTVPGSGRRRFGTNRIGACCLVGAAHPLSGDLTWRRLRPPSTPRSEPQWW